MYCYVKNVLNMTLICLCMSAYIYVRIYTYTYVLYAYMYMHIHMYCIRRNTYIFTNIPINTYHIYSNSVNLLNLNNNLLMFFCLWGYEDNCFVVYSTQRPTKSVTTSKSFKVKFFPDMAKN